MLDIKEDGKIISRAGPNAFTKFDYLGITLGEQDVSSSDQVSVVNYINWGTSNISGYHNTDNDKHILEHNAQNIKLVSDSMQFDGYITKNVTAGSFSGNRLTVDSSNAEISPSSNIFINFITTNNFTPTIGTELFIFNNGSAKVTLQDSSDIAIANSPDAFFKKDGIAFLKYNGNKWVVVNTDLTWAN